MAPPPFPTADPAGRGEIKAMPSHRIDRISEDIRRELTAILRTVKDPRVTDVMLSIVRAEVTNDLSYATVYISAMEGMEAGPHGGEGATECSGLCAPGTGPCSEATPCPGAAFCGGRLHRIQRPYRAENP